MEEGELSDRGMINTTAKPGNDVDMDLLHQITDTSINGQVKIGKQNRNFQSEEPSTTLARKFCYST